MLKFEKKQKEAGLISESDLKNVKYKVIYVVMVAIMVMMAAIAIIPALWGFMSGFKGSQEIYQIPSSFFPKEFRPSRIVEAWNDLSLGSNMLSTFLLAFCEVAGMLIVCGFGGYVISKLKPKGIKVIFVLVVWTMMMPSNVRLVPLYNRLASSNTVKSHAVFSISSLYCVAKSYVVKTTASCSNDSPFVFSCSAFAIVMNGMEYLFSISFSH